MSSVTLSGARGKGSLAGSVLREEGLESGLGLIGYGAVGVTPTPTPTASKYYNSSGSNTITSTAVGSYKPQPNYTTTLAPGPYAHSRYSQSSGADYPTDGSVPPPPAPAPAALMQDQYNQSQSRQAPHTRGDYSNSHNTLTYSPTTVPNPPGLLRTGHQEDLQASGYSVSHFEEEGEVYSGEEQPLLL